MIYRLFLFAALGIALMGSNADEAHFIRLRNDLIATPAVDRVGPQRRIAPAAAVSGLYLLQLESAPQPEWRTQLEQLGLQIFHYLPDDAFIVRAEGISLDSIRALPYVRWVGPYEPRHKIHPGLVQLMAEHPADRANLKLLLHPGVAAGEKAAVARAFDGPVRFHETRFGTYVSGATSSRKVFALAKMPAVLWIEKAPLMKMVDEIATKIVMGDNSQPGTRAIVQQLGFDGSGVTVAVADSGIDSGDPSTMHPDLFGRVDALFAYGGLPDASDEHSHGTHVAGIVAGNAATGEVDDTGNLYGLGVAPGAHLVAQRIFDGSGGFFPPDSFEALTRDAVNSGAYIGSNSWGDTVNGQYDLSASEFDALVRDASAFAPGEQPYVLEFSAGNEGPGMQTLDSPAVAKNVIATGAVENNRYDLTIYSDGQEVMADFSSRGPCEDGRIKPDVVAPGTWIASLKSQFAGTDNAWAPIDDYYLYIGGTSQAGPHASGACAVIVQWYRGTHGGETPSPALVKSLLINSATPMGTALVPGSSDGTDPTDPTSGTVVVGDEPPVPNMDEGWGRVDLTNLIGTTRRYDITDQNQELKTGDVFERHVVAGPDDQLKITLVYTDVPGLPAAIPALVNDLDLEVIAPDGQLYRGNAFVNGETVAGTVEGDRLNNVEAVHLNSPIAGDYTVRVRAHRVVQDIHLRTNTVPVQDFALVVSGELPQPGEGVISLDSPKYRLPGSVGIRLVDADLRGQTTAEVTVTSTSQTNAVTVSIAATGTEGAFAGQVNLSASPAPGKLFVADGDTIWVSYIDASPAGVRTRTASVDLVPPVIQGVTVTPLFGRVTLDWVTDEPTQGLLAYATTNGPFTYITNTAFATGTEIQLPQLAPDTVFRFYVTARDEAGNVTTNDNGGHYYYFSGPRPATALLLYSPETLLDGFGSTFTDVGKWSAPLDALGINYEVWDTGSVGHAPSAADLRPYKLVLWRPEELASPPAGLTAAITDYVLHGGNLFVASAEILSRIDPTDNAFRTNVLHVATYTEDQGANEANGKAGDPVSNGMAIALDYSNYPDLTGFIDWTTLPDQVAATPDASISFTQESGLPVGIRFPRTGADSNGRVIYLAFELEAVPADADSPNNTTDLFSRAIGFLVPSLSGGSSVTFDQPAYNLPSSVVIEVSDPTLAGVGSTHATIQSSSDTNGFQITLPETPLRGLFRTRFVLAATPSDVSRTTLHATNLDSVVATYVDSTNRILTAIAVVDTTPPHVSAVTSDPAYNESVIYWNTDKPSDALVRFGETPGGDAFFNRSAYSGESSIEHTVLLSGLLPDKDYYFEVISRDSAGNTVKDTNGGRYYQFRTLKPVPAPWSTDLESGSDGWAVFNDPSQSISGSGDGSTTSSWAYGTPTNTYGVQAHSGTNCWATNLKGENVDNGISDLISPAIDLTRGNRAMLHFWQWYDFTSRSELLDVEAGQVLISVDDGANWSAIYSPQFETSDDWEEIDTDISQFTGNVVRIRWNYQMLSFETVPRPGWFIDDVSIDLTNRAPSNFSITNNLAESTFTITGPTNFSGISGSGLTFNVTNAVPGDYIVSWGPVPFYDAPATQTNRLGTNGLVVAGIYTFVDSNHNGVADSWEIQYFGALVTGDISQRDSDGDGASDLQEFLAGTDPTNPNSSLRVATPSVQPSGLVKFTWPTVAGRLYQLQSATDLINWMPASSVVKGTGGTVTVTLPPLGIGRATVAYFFRVAVQP